MPRSGPLPVIYDTAEVVPKLILRASQRHELEAYASLFGRIFREMAAFKQRFAACSLFTAQ
jgi:hypothetical protein